MAIYLNDSFLKSPASRMIPFSAMVTSVEEGTLMVSTLENGVEVCAPSQGVANERIAGFALNNRKTPTVLPKYEEFVVPAQPDATGKYTVTLSRAPIAGLQIRQTNGDIAETLDAGGSFDAAEYQINGRVVTFPAAAAGLNMRFMYTFNPTVIEAQAMFGQFEVGEDTSAAVGGTGVISGADELYLTNYDPTDDWWAGNLGVLYSGPNGTVTLKNTGTPLPAGNWVVAAPSSNSPFLGLRVKL